MSTHSDKLTRHSDDFAYCTHITQRQHCLIDYAETQPSRQLHIHDIENDSLLWLLMNVSHFGVLSYTHTIVVS